MGWVVVGWVWRRGGWWAGDGVGVWSRWGVSLGWEVVLPLLLLMLLLLPVLLLLMMLQLLAARCWQLAAGSWLLWRCFCRCCSGEVGEGRGRGWLMRGGWWWCVGVVVVG